MVQLEPSLELCLKHLAPSGAVLPAEATAALDHSLPIKRSEAGLKSLVLWGRLLARNGKDYLIAEGCNTATVKGKAVSWEAKYYVSQDGVRWSDLPSVDAGVRERAAQLREQLSGDPAFQYAVKEPAAAAAAAATAAAGAQAGGEAGSDGVHALTEVQRVRAMIDSINAATAVVPKGAYVANAHNQVVPARLFGGLPYPDRLECYVHRSSALEEGPGGGLAADVRGSWAVQWDSLRGLTVLRSLLWPGYAFYYAAPSQAWGGLYVGDGLRNDDLVFML